MFSAFDLKTTKHESVKYTGDDDTHRKGNFESFRAALAKMRKLQQEYIYEAEQKMSEVEVVQGEDGTILGLREHPDLEPMFPSTEELFDFVNDASKFADIKALQDECLQKADEKVAVARQALELIDAKVQRLDHDLSAMETLLQVRRLPLILLANNLAVVYLILSIIAGNRRIPIRRCRQTQRHGSLSSISRFGMDFGKGVTSRCQHWNIQTCG